MADTETTTTPQNLRGAIMTMNPKIVLAFFLVVIAAALVVFLTIVLVKSSADGKSALDAGTVAILAGFVTTFLLMAKSASDYQFSSSAGSDKKDDAQTAVSKALADKVPAPIAPPPAVPPPAPDAWWGRLKNGEPAAITAAAAADPRVMAFITAANIGAAYLVSKGLLTQARADAIKAA